MKLYRLIPLVCLISTVFSCKKQVNIYCTQAFEESNIEKINISSTKGKFSPYFFSTPGNFSKVRNDKLDKDGVLLRKGSYNPTHIFQYGMNAYKFYKSDNDEEAKTFFINQLRWLKNNFETNKNNTYGFWKFKNPNKGYDLEGNWPSGLTQGMGIGMAMMGYELTKQKEYLEIAGKALNAYQVPVEQGGFLRCWNGETWFEEYPTKESSRVLNGFLFSLAGLYNIYENTDNELAYNLFNEGVNTLKNNIEDYDAKFVSRYNLYNPHKPNLAKQSYHKIHVWQLLWLYSITDEIVFKNTAQDYLEIQKTKFGVKGKNIINRIKKVSASNSTKNHGPENILDDRWGWGNTWNSKNDSKLFFELDGIKSVYGFTIFFNKKESAERPFKVFVDNSSEKVQVEDFEQINSYVHMSSQNRETYINTYKFPIRDNVSSLEIEFENSDMAISINEINLFISMQMEVEQLLKKVEDKKRSGL